MRAFAVFYPNDIAGLMFIDPADFTETKEEWNSIFKSLNVPDKRIDEMLYDRLYKKTKIDSAFFGPSSENAVLTEMRRTDFIEVRNLPVPNVPIYFMIGGRFEVPPEKQSKDFNHEEFFTKRTNINIERWKKFIYSSTKGGTLLYLSNCGHYLHREDPKAVINSLKMLVESVEGNQ